MGLPIITRHLAIRDDYPDAAITQLNSGSVSSSTLTSDGDIATWNVTFTNPSQGDIAIIYRPITGGPDPSVFKAGMVRLAATLFPVTQVSGSAAFQVRQWFSYTPSNTTDVGQFSLVDFSQAANLNRYFPVQTPLVNGAGLVGNTTNQIGFEILCVGTPPAGAYNFTLLLDFVMQFKELMTLPSVRQPIMSRKRVNVQEVPILQRGGGQQQVLGDFSREVTVGGHLVSTSAGQGLWTNTYTADQWWYLLDGMASETDTIQADGNPTWQWFQSDQVQGKYLVQDIMLQQPMGRNQYWDYLMQLKKFDVNAETFINDLGPGPGGIIY